MLNLRSLSHKIVGKMDLDVIVLMLVVMQLTGRHSVEVLFIATND